MQPSDRDLVDEIRGHLALSIKERIERGEEPAAARRLEAAYAPNPPSMVCMEPVIIAPCGPAR